MLCDWMADMEAQEKRISDWEKRYAQYVKKVKKTPNLRDSRAFLGNPVNGDGLAWEHPRDCLGPLSDGAGRAFHPRGERAGNGAKSGAQSGAERRGTGR